MDNFESLRPDLFLPEAWSDEDKEAVVEEVRSKKIKTSMYSDIPMNCKAAKCKFASTCPLQQENKAPKGKPCPYELAMVRQFMMDYLEELQVDPNSITEIAMVRDLVNAEIQSTRATKILADEHFIQDNIVGIDERTGEALLRPELHQAVHFEEKIHKRKKDLRNQLLATREAKAKAGQGNVDTSQVLSEIVDQVREFDRKRDALIKDKLGSKAIDDPYINQDIQDAEVIDVEPEDD
jgi:hypothetical protein